MGADLTSGTGTGRPSCSPFCSRHWWSRRPGPRCSPCPPPVLASSLPSPFPPRASSATWCAGSGTTPETHGSGLRQRFWNHTSSTRVTHDSDNGSGTTPQTHGSHTGHTRVRSETTVLEPHLKLTGHTWVRSETKVLEPHLKLTDHTRQRQRFWNYT